jgi:hypothetical protein
MCVSFTSMPCPDLTNVNQDNMDLFQAMVHMDKASPGIWLQNPSRTRHVISSAAVASTTWQPVGDLLRIIDFRLYLLPLHLISTVDGLLQAFVQEKNSVVEIYDVCGINGVLSAGATTCDQVGALIEARLHKKTPFVFTSDEYLPLWSRAWRKDVQKLINLSGPGIIRSRWIKEVVALSVPSPPPSAVLIMRDPRMDALGAALTRVLTRDMDKQQSSSSSSLPLDPLLTMTDIVSVYTDPEDWNIVDNGDIGEWMSDGDE